jgi:hypothetical protein
LNFYLAYTLPEYRHQGFASQIVAHLEKKALDGGWNRMKSLAGSYGGVRLHMHMGHTFWGVHKSGALIVDTPLNDLDEFPEGTPIEARSKGATAERMTLHEMANALLEPPFSVTLPLEAMEAYIKKERRSL